MATAMYGAPIGFIAQEEQANKTALLQLQAEETMGKLAEIPSSNRLRNAQAANLEGQAAARDAEGADLAAMDRYEKEVRAKRVSQQVALTQGRDANVQDLEASDPARVSDPMLELYNHMVNSGAPSRLTAPLAEKIAKVREDEASAMANEALTRTRKLEEEAKLADRIGTMAQTALASPEGYAQMRLLATQQGAKLPPGIKKIIDGLPQDWNAAKRMLTPLALNALSVKDQKELALKEEKNKQDIATGKATEARALASAALAGVRTTLVKQQTTELRKLGGDGTPSQIASRELADASKLQEMRAKQLVQSPYAPIDPSKAVLGKTYTFKDGRVARLITRSDGTPGWDLVAGTKPWKDIPAPRTAEEIRKDLRAGMAAVGGSADEED